MTSLYLGWIMEGKRNVRCQCKEDIGYVYDDEDDDDEQH
jgi:hypothetical protein